MSSRRFFLKSSLLSLAGFSLSSSAYAFGLNFSKREEKPLLRFALASDGHYGQKGTDSDALFTDIINWLNREHSQKPLDFVLFNGDLVHDRPDLLKHIKSTYFEKLQFPFYAVPGNHDHASNSRWQEVFGYPYDHTLDKQGIGFILLNTSNEKGDYLCPDAVFLKSKLEAFKEKQTVFIVMHIPPVKWLKEDDFYADCPDIMKMIASYKNVKAIFHGHDHNLDGVRYSAKVPHFFDAHFGGNWGTTYRGYRIVEVSASGAINTFQVNASASPYINSTRF